ncbi:hypothetical protein ACVJGD_004447 [Bradyrhizobium sp. USDA 10063]
MPNGGAITVVVRNVVSYAGAIPGFVEILAINDGEV